ncbi:MAG: hypothetical protein V8R80_06465 [Eubacterium sp.]
MESDGRRIYKGSPRTLQYSAYEVKYWIQYTIGSLKMLVTRQVSLNAVRPVGICKHYRRCL